MTGSSPIYHTVKFSQLSVSQQGLAPAVQGCPTSPTSSPRFLVGVGLFLQGCRTDLQEGLSQWLKRPPSLLSWQQ